MDTNISNIDTAKVEEVINTTTENANYFEETTFSIVSGYAQPLDDLMKEIYSEIVMVDYPAIDTLEKYFLELTNTVYFMGEKLESLGIRDTISKSQYKEIYNKAYLGSQIKDAEKKNKTTIAESTAIAEGAALYEGTVNDIYSRAYKMLKYKIDAANEMIKSLSKIISRRMTEMQLTDKNYYPDNVGGTNG